MIEVTNNESKLIIYKVCGVILDLYNCYSSRHREHILSFLNIPGVVEKLCFQVPWNEFFKFKEISRNSRSCENPSYLFVPRWVNESLHCYSGRTI